MRVSPALLFTTCVLTPLLAASGCSSYRAPTFEAVAVRELQRENDLAVVVFVIEATNPNPEPMQFGQASYTLWLDGREVFSGVRSPQATVHTYSKHTFELPAVVPASLTDAPTDHAELPYRLSGSVIYKNPGALADVLFDAEVVVPQASIDLEGTINLGH